MKPHEEESLQLVTNEPGSFLTSRNLRKKIWRFHLTPSHSAHKTSWLDGLRGLASLSIIAYHWSGYVLRDSDIAYGTPESDMSSSLLQLPVIRLLYAGPANVCLFFVISGYVLSVKPVELMRRSKGCEKDSEMLQSFSSSISRRFVRLYLPAWASTVIPFLYHYLNMRHHLGIDRMESSNCWGEYEAAFATVKPVIVSRNPPSDSSFVQQLGHLTVANYNMTAILSSSSRPRIELENPYNNVLWTIPLEYRASLLLFMVQIAVVQFEHRYAMAVIVGLMGYSIIADRMDMLLFLGGFAIAMVQPWFASLEQKLARTTDWSIIYNTALWCGFAIGLWLGSYPGVYAQTSPGFRFISTWIPPTWTWRTYWWTSCSALLNVFCVSQLAVLRRLLSKPLCLYIGRISFSIYVIHWFLMEFVGNLSLYFFTWATGNLDRHNKVLYAVGFTFSLSLVYTAVICCAHVFWTVVDAPSSRFSTWLVQRLRRKLHHSRAAEP